MRTAALTTLVLTAFLAAPTETPLDAGLKPGAEVPGPFQPYAVTGKDAHRGKFHSPVSEHGLDPTVLIFIRGIDAGPAAALLPALDAAVVKNERLRLGAVVIFLLDDIEDAVTEDVKREQAAARIQDQMGKYKHMEAYLDVPADVKEYHLNDKAEVTVLMYDRYRILVSRAYSKDGLKDEAAKALVADINAQLDAIREQQTGKKR
jgi:hypothetical protein